MPVDVAPTAGTRRRFLIAAGAAATLAAPQVSRAQTVSWKFQSAWSTREFQHEFAVDYARKVADMTGGRFRLNVLAAGSVVPPFQLAEASHSGILDGGIGMALSPLGRHRAHALFGNPPPFGWDSHGFVGWFYHGGGEALYREWPAPTKWSTCNVSRKADC
jgi:TRAP-type mannitol/chloroaromatic compound transport system substrate-binding protein